MKPSNIFAIVKKELRTYFDSPTAYIVLSIFLLLWQFLFFRDAFIIAEASLRNLMAYVPWLFLVLIPALTMGSVATEKSDGTMEFLLTHPLKSLELILGKFIAAFLFVGFGLTSMFAIAWSFDQFGDVDWGVVWGQYLGSLLLAGVFISLGIFVSSMFANQISALLVSVCASFILIIIGLEIVTLSVPWPLSEIFERISVLTHFMSISRGVIDLRDVWYFLSVIAIFLSLSFLQFLHLRMGNQKKLFQTYTLAIGLFIGSAVLVNIIGQRMPGRLDLTEDQIYQLSPATLEVLNNLDDKVVINLYASTELPAQLRPILRDTKDILRDYDMYSNNQVEVSIKDPSTDTAISQEANSLGVREVQFNVIDQEGLELKRGYLGLAVLYGGKTEIIPIINTASDLEYQLTSYIRKLTTDDKKTVAFLTGHGEKDLNTDYSIWADELTKLYGIVQLTLDEESDQKLDETISTLIIAGPTQEITQEQRAQIFEYFKNGGSVFFLTDGVTVNQNSLVASVNNNSLADFLPTFGIELGQDIVADYRSNETVNFGGPQGVNYVLAYPFWPRVVADTNTSSTLTKQIRSLVLPWPSSLEINNETLTDLNLSAQTLFVTTDFANSQILNFDIQPNQQSIPTDLSKKKMVVSLIGQSNADSDKTPRAIIVGDSDFLTDAFVTNTFENLAFGTESVAWLTQETSLAEIQLKQRQSRNLLFSDKSQTTLVRYGNMGFVIGIVLVVAAVRLYRRRSLQKQTYQYEQ